MRVLLDVKPTLGPELQEKVTGLDDTLVATTDRLESFKPRQANRASIPMRKVDASASAIRT